MGFLLLLIAGAVPELVLLPLALVVAVGGLVMIGGILFGAIAVLVQLVVTAVEWVIQKIRERIS